MSPGETKSGLSLAGSRELILPVTVLGCFVLYYVLELPGWTVFALALPMGLLFALAPRWAARSVASFDRDLVRLLATGQRAALRRRYAYALGMRLFSPPAVSAERRAVVAAENGLPREAKAGYLVALHSYGKPAPLRVLLGYAHACYSLGDDTQAISTYRELLEHAGALPGVRRNLAHALVRRGESLREALELMDVDAATDGHGARGAERDLMRALAHAKLGERERATELAGRSAGADSELAESLRVALQRELDGITTARPA
jgi:hypothetical protein